MQELAASSFHPLWKYFEAVRLEYVVSELVDAAFAPRLIAKQVVCILAVQSLVLASRGVFAGYKWCLGRLREKERTRRKLEDMLKIATTYEEWNKLAEKLDELDGNNVWRSDDSSVLFDSRVLRRRIQELRVMMRNNDIFHLIFRIRSGLAREKYGIQNPQLFAVARGGTKHIIEEYHNVVCEALDFVASCDDSEVAADVRLAFFNETRHSYGRSALLLSGGAALGFYHIGLAKCLHLEGLLPRVISGASAGSLMAAMLGTRAEDELMDMIDTGTGFRRDFFRLNFAQRSDDHFSSRLQYMLPQSLRWISDSLLSLVVDRRSLLAMDTDHLKNVVIENVGLYTFQEAFDRTGRIINIVVAPLNPFDPPRLLNYLTAPHLCIWSAVVASCAIPGVFESIQLVVKEPDGNYRAEVEAEYFGGEVESSSKDHREQERYSDGSIERDLPMQQLSELFNVNHFIVSQVNPHSYLLSSLAMNVDHLTPALFGSMVGILRFLKAQCRDWLRNVIDLMVYGSVAPEWAGRRGFTQLLTQEYEGRSSDVSIMPWAGDLSIVQAFLSLIRNPSDAEYQRMLKASEKNTWPHVCKIRSHCRIEMTLDKCVQKLRRVVTGGVKDRTPSFYTSRSIVNLSGLGVVDPVSPIVVESHSSGDLKKPAGGIKKTTSMANFYYSRDPKSNSNSNDKIADTQG